MNGVKHFAVLLAHDLGLAHLADLKVVDLDSEVDEEDDEYGGGDEDEQQVDQRQAEYDLVLVDTNLDDREDVSEHKHASEEPLGGERRKHDEAVEHHQTQEEVLLEDGAALRLFYQGLVCLNVVSIKKHGKMVGQQTLKVNQNDSIRNRFECLFEAVDK